MAEILYPHADQHVVELHEEHIAGVKLGAFVQRLEGGSWVECPQEESHGQIVSEVGLLPAQPARPPGRNPATGDVFPGQPAKPASRAKVHVAIHAEHIGTIKAALGYKE